MITQQELKEVLSYNPLDGIFTWKKSFHKSRIGTIAGYINKRGYIAIRVNKKTYYAHRLAWLYTHGELPKKQIDHINGDTSDNRLSNLRDVSTADNGRNRRVGLNNTSGIMGVVWHKNKNKWIVNIKVDMKRHYLGYYSNIFDAACVRISAQNKLGFHENHGRR